MPFTIEGVVAAILVVSLFITILGPALYSTLSPALAGSFNASATNSSGQLQGYVFKQVNNTAFCGEATKNCGQNSTGGFSAITATSGSGFAFVLQGFGVLVGSLIQAPIIMTNMLSNLMVIIGYPTTAATAMKGDLEAFVIFIFLLVAISAYMKFPLRNS
jgi:hypothetical protein